MPPPRRREGASHLAESEAGPRSQLVKGETEMTHRRVSWPAVEVLQHFTHLPTQAPPAPTTRLSPQPAVTPLPLLPHTDGTEDAEHADAGPDMPVASIESLSPPPVRQKWSLARANDRAGDLLGGRRSSQPSVRPVDRWPGVASCRVYPRFTRCFRGRHSQVQANYEYMRRIGEIAQHCLAPCRRTS